jgi:hypothetical protein
LPSWKVTPVVLAAILALAEFVVPDAVETGDVPPNPTLLDATLGLNVWMLKLCVWPLSVWACPGSTSVAAWVCEASLDGEDVVGFPAGGIRRRRRIAAVRGDVAWLDAPGGGIAHVGEADAGAAPHVEQRHLLVGVEIRQTAPGAAARHRAMGIGTVAPQVHEQILDIGIRPLSRARGGIADRGPVELDPAGDQFVCRTKFYVAYAGNRRRIDPPPPPPDEGPMTNILG